MPVPMQWNTAWLAGSRYFRLLLVMLNVRPNTEPPDGRTGTEGALGGSRFQIVGAAPGL